MKGKDCMLKFVRGFVFIATICFSSMAMSDTVDYSKDTPEQTAKRMKWFTDARFGMFIHWGPVSLKGTEIGWSRAAMPVEEYDTLYKSFNPEKFNAKEWVSIAKAAGMKYMVLTAKHHDGFCLWDTKATDYNIMNSPFGRDVVKELAVECKKQGIVFCAYYTVLDWYHPDYNTAGTYGGPGFDLPEGVEPSMDRFVEYMKAQLGELITNYGPLGLIWFDGEWERAWTADRGDDMYQYVRQLQPSIIINNRVSKGRHAMAGTTKQTIHNPGDYDTPEQRVGGFYNERPWETCMTICRQWAWKPNDNMKSLKQCIQTLVATVGCDGNLLFNVGPMADGRIEPRQVVRLKEMGAWLKKYGETVYETNGGPYKPQPWIYSTHKDKSIYLHILDFDGETITLPAIDAKIKSAKLLTGGKVRYTQTQNEITVTVFEKYQQEIDTIVELKLDRQACSIEPISFAALSLTFEKKATASNTFMSQLQYAPDKATDGSDSTRWATDVGTKAAWLQVDLGKDETFSKAFINEAFPGRVQKFQLQKKVDGGWQTFHEGATIGKNELIKFDPVTAQHVRLNILEATEGPTLYQFQLLK
jgi:alpha-L-fucosidase